MDTIPQKYFYTIGDVCRMTNTKPHILRYWESQFRLLRPARRYSGHRKYTQTDIEMISRIRFLIVERRFTLAGAKKELARQTVPKPSAEQKAAAANPSSAEFLRDVKKEIADCLEILNPQPQQQELLKI